MDDKNEKAPMEQAEVNEAFDAIAFDVMSPRMHRKQAQELLLCPEHGVLGASVGQSFGTDTEAKVKALETALGRMDEARTHLVAAIEGYKSQAAES